MAKRTKVGLKLNNTDIFVNNDGLFELAFSGDTLTAASVKDLQEELRKARGVRNRKPLNLDVMIFIDEGWGDTEVHEGTLLGYHASGGALRLKKKGQNAEKISNSARVHIVLTRRKDLPKIKKLWKQRVKAWATLSTLNNEIADLLEKVGTDAHGSWSINIDNVLEKEQELGKWITKEVE